VSFPLTDCAQTVRSNVEDAKELAEQAAVLYVSIGKEIDPSQAKEELRGKPGDVAAVIKSGCLLDAMVLMLIVVAGF
jgi:hypothetical protein